MIEMLEWISVKYKLPAENIEVLACDNYDIRIAEYGIGYVENVERQGWWIDQNFDWDEVTHWMPLPSLPEKNPKPKPWCC